MYKIRNGPVQWQISKSVNVIFFPKIRYIITKAANTHTHTHTHKQTEMDDETMAIGESADLPAKFFLLRSQTRQTELLLSAIAKY